MSYLSTFLTLSSTFTMYSPGKATLIISFFILLISQISSGQRSFDIDWSNNVFLKDGQPFQYISGSIHYFRVPVEYWSDRMVKMKAAGLNAIQTYIEWRSHEPSIGNYNFNDNLDLFRFIEMAKANNLLVILRPGPYICAERDRGGLPSWLLSEDDSIKLRTSDPRYLVHVTRWFNHLLPRLVPYLYKNGGPIIMMQVENEYGSFQACDLEYTNYLRDMMASLTNNDVALFTTDGNALNYLKCGLINGTLATIDFGPDANVTKSYSILRSRQPNGPLVNSEYYTGWLDHWSESRSSVASDGSVINTLDIMLSMNVSINMYMFHGGTSFDLGAGANYADHIQPQPTSYDFHAPLTEAGDMTSKYFAIRETISKYFPIEPIPAPRNSTKMSLTVTAKRYLNWDKLIDIAVIKQSDRPLSFESLNVTTGFIVYSATINITPSDPALLSIPDLRDRAIVYVDGKRQGVLSRQVTIYQLPIEARFGSRLEILVENEGRINYGSLINERKGIIGDVKLGPLTITNWTHIIFPDMSNFLTEAANMMVKINNHNDNNNNNVLNNRNNVHRDKHYNNVNGETGNPYPDPLPSLYPAIFRSSFQLGSKTEPADTFLNPVNFTKGIASLNGHLLGRYWPHTGPQVTLYVPGVWFKPYPEMNELLIWETMGVTEYFSLDGAFDHVCVQFQEQPILNGSVPFSNKQIE